LYISVLSNLALNKPAYQTDTNRFGSAGLAVDGNTRQSYFAGSCSHTKTTDAIWEVDLGELCVIANIVIYNRQDCCGKHFLV